MTPIRQCQFTSARLPSHLLQRYSAVFEPVESNEGRLDASIVPQPSKPSAQSGTIYGPSSSYVISHCKAVEYLNTKRHWAQLVTGRMREAYDARAVGNKASATNKWYKEWHRDSKMPDTILKMLRSDVTDGIEEVVGSEDGTRYLIPMDKLQGLASFAALPTGVASTHHNRSATSMGYVVIPAYRLDHLLDGDLLASTQRQEEVDRFRHVGVIQHTKTVALHLALRRLCAYLRDEESETLTSVSHAELARMDQER